MVFDNVSDKTQDFIVDFTKISYDKGCRIYREDGTCIVEFEGADEKVKEFIDELIFMAGCSDEVKEYIVKGLEAPDVKFTNEIKVVERHRDMTNLNSVTLHDGSYKDLKPIEALNRYGDIAVVRLMTEYMSDQYDDLTKKAVEYNIRKYVTKYKEIKNEDLYKKSLDEVKAFINTYSVFLKSKVDSIINRATCSDLETFLANSTEEVIKSAYKAMCRELYRKFNQ